MRMTDHEFDKMVNDVLADKTAPSADFAETLFAKADVLLEGRREFLAARARRPHLDAHLRLLKLWTAVTENLSALAAEARSTISDLIGARPLSASLAMLAIAAAFVVVATGRDGQQGLHLADLREFPRLNTASAEYEALWKAERFAYDQEVADAQRQSSGSN